MNEQADHLLPASDDLINQALDTCASEPVHIPGCVQPFACLICANAETLRITYASANCAEITGIPVQDLLGANLRDVLGRELRHALSNAAARPNFAGKAASLGRFKLGEIEVEATAFASGDTHVLQLERARDADLGGGDALGALTFLMNEIQSCSNQDSLFDLTTSLLKHLTGYDRVMIYKFDAQFNGEVLTETKPARMEPFVGLRFPQWDIPAQARAIMKKLPLRFIQDVDQSPVPLLAADATLPPLDITLAACRGVSPVHMEYLRNMGSRSTLTLSVTVADTLWGMISFHHRRPRVPTATQREVLTAFLDLFTTKLTALQTQAQLDLLKKVDRIRDSVLADIDDDETIEEAMPRIGPVVLEVLGAVGVAVLNGSQVTGHGTIPGQAVLSALQSVIQVDDQTQVISENLSLRFPDLEPDLNGCAGVLAFAITPTRILCVFRAEQGQSVSWAGNPDKTIEFVAGTARLAPRGSFSMYMQDVQGHSAPWTEEDIYFAERIWILINSAERRALKNTMNRQQALMINELNHRVRNILALVRSVSRQARQHYSSLESYSASLENRIQALAAAHNLASGTGHTAVSLHHLIEVETTPFQQDNRIRITGPDRPMRADIAPIFSLVIHELVTNAAKYGALSSDAGTVDIGVTETVGGVRLTWQESGGPHVATPANHGFGTTLIEQAVPHEMGGTSVLEFHEAGVRSELMLPDTIFDAVRSARTADSPDKPSALPLPTDLAFDPGLVKGPVLLLEDNFMLAKDMNDQLSESGLDEILVCSTAEDALELIDADQPAFAVLDVNLGPDKNSEAVALKLLELGVPFLFVTGYGDNSTTTPEIAHVPRLTKPAATRDLQGAMMSLLRKAPV